jgi:hypothetical protein
MLSAHDVTPDWLRAPLERARQGARLLAWSGLLACNPPKLVPAAMPVRPPLVPAAMPVRPREPYADPELERRSVPEVAVEEPIPCVEARGSARAQNQGGAWPFSAARLTPALNVDYLALRLARGERRSVPAASAEAHGVSLARGPARSDAEDWTSTDFEVLSEHGDPCVSAPPGSSCAQGVERHPAWLANPECVEARGPHDRARAAEREPAPSCSEIAVVTTRGGEVRRWATADELRELLAPIDTPDEALLLVRAEHHEVSCEPGRTRLLRVKDGYEVRAARLASPCESGVWLHVTDTGRVGEVSRDRAPRAETQRAPGEPPSAPCPSRDVSQP